MENIRVNQPKPSILIVSPPGDLQIGLQALLKTHLDVDVLVTSEGSSAYKALNIFMPDLVILDQDLSLNSGVEIAQEIKKLWPNMITIVFVNNEEKGQDYFSLGVDRIFTKGIPAPELIKEIQNLLASK